MGLYDLYKKSPRVGLALGSGGIRGASHIGVIKVLEENKIPIDFIAGSSVGAIIGGGYAALKDIKKIEELTLSMKWRDTLSLLDTSFKGGIIKGAKIHEFLEKILGRLTFKDLKIPFVAVATDIKTGETILLSEGNLTQAIRASAGFPLMVKPINLKGKLLLDGGLSDPVPVDIVRKMGADIVIAVNLNSQDYLKEFKERTFYSVGARCIDIMQYRLSKYGVESAEISIEPFYSLKGGGIKAFKKFFDEDAKNIILAGEKATIKILPRIKELLKI